MLQKNKTLLIIDDDPLFNDAVFQYYANQDMKVFTARTGKEGLKICSQNKIDVILLDQKLPDGKGVNYCSSILSQNDHSKIIFVTAYPSLDNAIEAVKAGAHDYLSKPFELKELDLTLERALRAQELEKERQIQSYKNGKENKETVLIGKSKTLTQIQKLIDIAASNKANVILTGETGTGKNLVAKSIHFRSSVNVSTFISINCAALPEGMIESELFGYEKGAFTGASSTKKGIFEMAEGGTLFLDEIGTLPFHLQSKLLGVLDDKRIRRLGGESSKQVDVRIISATNKLLEQEVKNNNFREDLFYRLSVLRIHLPPLREHAEDIPDLCHYFLKKSAPTLDIHLARSETNRLKQYDWPGNIRELKNIMERAVILHQGNTFRPSELIGHTLLKNSPPNILPEIFQARGSVPEQTQTRIIPLSELEQTYIRYTLEKMDNNRTLTARALGISRSTLMRKIRN